MKIALFYHCVFCLGDPPDISANAFGVVAEQMEVFKKSGLLEVADEFHVGINGAEESQPFADCIIPESALKVYHGIQCRNELRTIMLMQHTMRGRRGWFVFYGHAKGASHPPDDKMSFNWRNCMMHNLVTNWEICVESLSRGFDAAGCHWKTGQVDGTQSLFGGNCYWVKSDFLNTLPPIENNRRLPIMGGIDAYASRYEAEIILGSGRKPPKVVDYHPSGPFTCGK
jgi:hypothetical protein